MGGCTNCASKGSCSTRKGDERQLLGQLLPELYPGRRYGELDDDARDGVGEREGRRLARQASELLQAPTFFRPGEASEACDYIYVLCVGREPALVELVEGESIDFQEGEHVHEKYLRATLSNLARVATVQEVSMSLSRDGELWRIDSQPSPGIYDPILLKRTRKLVELIVAADISYLDYGVIESPPVGFDGGEWAADFGRPPDTVNYLFSPRPSRATSTQYLPVRVA
jgi:hypothetical protein